MARELTRPDMTAVDAYHSGDVAAIMRQQTKAVGTDTAFSQGYLQFSGNTGEYMIRDKVVSKGTLWAFNVYEARAQWLGWSDGKVYDRKEALLREGGFMALPSRAELEAEHPIPIKRPQMDGWKETIVFPVRDMEGEYGQLEITLHADNKTKRPRPAWMLVHAWLDYIEENAQNPMPIFVPIVEIDAHDFPSQGGKKWAPDLNIEEWLTLKELDEQFGHLSAEDDVEEETPEETEPASTSKRFGQRKGGRAA